MTLFTTKARTKKQQWLWFIGFYIASIVVLGSFYFLLHTLLGWIA